jgi:hypothetical protein
VDVCPTGRGPPKRLRSLAPSANGAVESQAPVERRISMDDIAVIREANMALTRRINEEGRADPSSPYSGKFVGIANGEVVVVDVDDQLVSRRLWEIEPDSRRVWFVEASRDYSVVEYV